MRIKSFVICTFLLFTSIACSKKNSNENILIDYRKNKCFGNCEEYNVKILENGVVAYHGINNMELLGDFSSAINKNKITELNDLFIKVNFKTFLNEYLNKNLRDLPKIELQFRDKKIVYHRRNAPKELIQLADSIEVLLSKIMFEEN